MATYDVKLKLPPINIAFVDAQGKPSTQFYRWAGMVQLILNPNGSDTVFSTQQQVTQNAADIAAIVAEQPSYALKATTVTAGNGLTGSGDLGADLTLDAVKNTGWTAGTGTANKGTFATYAGQTVSTIYVQTEAQTTDNAVVALAQRVLALEEALRANGAIN